MNDIASLATAGYVMIETLPERMPSRSGGPRAPADLRLT
jgi:hypothetical protein